MEKAAIEINKEQRIQHHFAVANNILERLGLSDKCVDLEHLVKAYIHLTLNRWDYDLLSIMNIALQIQSIKKLQNKLVEVVHVSSISIYRELDPVNICMMGNWVDGSCLSFDSGVGNYWSAFTNALECNK